MRLRETTHTTTAHEAAIMLNDSSIIAMLSLVCGVPEASVVVPSEPPPPGVGAGGSGSGPG